MFEFELSQDERAMRIQVADQKFDITLATEFRSQVEEAWKDTVEAVTVNFSSVEFIDSSGVGALVSVHKRVAKKGGALRIERPSPAVTSVIELLRLHRVFELVDG